MLQGGIGEEKLWGKKQNFLYLLVCSTSKKLNNEDDLDGNVYSTQAQAASSSLFEAVLLVHCLAVLDLWAGVEQTINCLIIQNGQGVQSKGRLMDWVSEDNMVNG